MVRVPPYYLPLVGVLFGLVLVYSVGFGLNLNELPEGVLGSWSYGGAQSPTPIKPESSEHALVTSVGATYVRWAGLFAGLMVAWFVVLAISADLVRRHWKRFGLKRFVTIFACIGAVAIVLLILETLDVLNLGAGPQRMLDNLEAPSSFSIVRNVLGWITAAFVVVATMLLTAGETAAFENVDSLKTLGRDLRSFRVLMTSTAISLAVGVAQVSALIRTVLTRNWSDATNWLDLKTVVIPDVISDMEATLTFAAGILFSALAALCFLPALVILERARASAVAARLAGNTTETAQKTAEQELKGAGLHSSAWTSLSEAMTLLLPVISGAAISQF